MGLSALAIATLMDETVDALSTHVLPALSRHAQQLRAHAQPDNPDTPAAIRAMAVRVHCLHMLIRHCRDGCRLRR